MTIRLSASTATPVTCRPRTSLTPAFGTRNTLRLMPDCMLNSSTSPAWLPTRPKLPHAVTHDTVALPSVAHVCLPARLFSTDQVRPSDSSTETDTTSSQSREREVEYESDVMSGSLSDEGRTSRRVALRAIEPATCLPSQLIVLPGAKGGATHPARAQSRASRARRSCNALTGPRRQSGATCRRRRSSAPGAAGRGDPSAA